jgi:hypothetical protein
MEILQLLGVAVGLASLAGLNLYLTVFLTGLAVLRSAPPHLDRCEGGVLPYFDQSLPSHFERGSEGTCQRGSAEFGSRHVLVQEEIELHPAARRLTDEPLEVRPGGDWRVTIASDRTDAAGPFDGRLAATSAVVLAPA